MQQKIFLFHKKIENKLQLIKDLSMFYYCFLEIKAGWFF
jgi:hypothetical protein